MPSKIIKDRSAQQHKRVRMQHSDELAQDYVEAIYILRKETGLARVVDLTKVFGVSHVSVIRALGRLAKRNLVVRCTDEGITLTEEGEALAAKTAERHSLVVNFLCEIGVSNAQAEADAEGIEHHLSMESIDAIRRFLKKDV